MKTMHVCYCSGQVSYFKKSLKALGGFLSPLTQKIAKIGSGGKYPGNVERDLHNVLNLPIPIYWLELPLRSLVDRKSLETAWVPMMLPHQIYHYLFDPLLYLEI